MTVTHYSSLGTLAGTIEPSGAWWVSVARALDDLDERLAEDTAVDEGPTGAFADAVSREPSLSNGTTRLAADHARLVERARQLRRLVAEVAGDPSAGTRGRGRAGHPGRGGGHVPGAVASGVLGLVLP